ncbi:MAG: hypothetical protein IE885_01920 [Campylobacterales bacterium]|nr:hypothetical protein [Campylobacterales bacterium]
MQKMTIKEYAQKHKLSIFNVVKMTRSGELETQTVNENGKDIIFIIVKNENTINIKESQVSDTTEPYSLRKENERLKAEILQLKEEIKELKKIVSFSDRG